MYVPLSVALRLQSLRVGKDEWQCKYIIGQAFKLAVIQAYMLLQEFITYQFIMILYFTNKVLRLLRFCAEFHHISSFSLRTQLRKYMVTLHVIFLTHFPSQQKHICAQNFLSYNYDVFVCNMKAVKPTFMFGLQFGSSPFETCMVVKILTA
jgi:hypothetical protein